MCITCRLSCTCPIAASAGGLPSSRLDGGEGGVRVVDSRVRESSASPPTPSSLLLRARQTGDRVLDRLCEGRWWELKVTVFAALTSILLAFPNFSTFSDNERDWTYVIHKGHSLMYQEDPH